MTHATPQHDPLPPELGAQARMLDRLAAADRGAFSAGLASRIVAACADPASDAARSILDRDAALARSEFGTDRADRVAMAAVAVSLKGTEAEQDDTASPVIGRIAGPSAPSGLSIAGQDRRAGQDHPAPQDSAWSRLARRSVAAAILIAGGGLALLLATRGSPISSINGTGFASSDPSGRGSAGGAFVPETPGRTETGGTTITVSAEMFASDIADAWAAFDEDLCQACTLGVEGVQQDADALGGSIDDRWGDWASEGWGEGAL